VRLKELKGLRQVVSKEATIQEVSDSINTYDIRVSGENETLPCPLK